MPCDYCEQEFDPIATRWLCPHCHMKANCCDGAPQWVGSRPLPAGTPTRGRARPEHCGGGTARGGRPPCRHPSRTSLAPAGGAVREPGWSTPSSSEPGLGPCPARPARLSGGPPRRAGAAHRGDRQWHRRHRAGDLLVRRRAGLDRPVGVARPGARAGSTTCGQPATADVPSTTWSRAPAWSGPP